MPGPVDVDPRLLADLTGRRALSSRILARLAWSGVMTDHRARSGEKWSAPEFFWWRRRSPEQLVLERRHARWLGALHARRALASAAALRSRGAARREQVAYAPASVSPSSSLAPIVDELPATARVEAIAGAPTMLDGG